MKNDDHKVFTHCLKNPAQSWTEGHILGNGDIGAVVWGSPDSLFVGFSKHDIQYLKNVEHGIRWDLTYPEILGKMKDNPPSWLMGIGNKTKSWEWANPIPLSCGRLRLEPCRGAQLVDFYQELNFKKAECNK